MKPEEMLRYLNQLIAEAGDDIGFGRACGYIRALNDLGIINIVEACNLIEKASDVYAA